MFETETAIFAVRWIDDRPIQMIPNGWPHLPRILEIEIKDEPIISPEPTSD